ncbi:MAG: hypothetical protein AAB571_13530, partial [Chloroflexota bacterium]
KASSGEGELILLDQDRLLSSPENALLFIFGTRSGLGGWKNRKTPHPLTPSPDDEHQRRHQERGN